MRSAVLIIDVQQGLCEGPDAAWQSAETIDRINAVTARARAAGVPVFFIQHEGKDGYLTHGSREWQLTDGLSVEATDLRVRKTATDSFHQTDLDDLLKRHGVTDLVIGGMHSEYCVDTTTRRALALGYPVVLIADGHTSSGTPALSAAQVIAHHNHVLSHIESFGPRVRPIAAADVRFN